MFELENGRKHFFQWDTGQRLIIADATVIEAHFCNRTGECSLTCEAYTDGGKRVVDVPNILLQEDWDIRVYAFCGNYTKVEERFEVVKRSKPADYVYTETEVKSWEALANRTETTLNEIDTLAAEVSSAEAQRIAAEEARKAAAAEMEAATEEAQQAAAEAQTAIETLINNAHAPAITAEKTAAVVNVVDAAAGYAVGAKIHITATQEGSGDASPENIRPIIGCDSLTINRAQKNLLDINAIDLVVVFDDKPTDKRYGVRKIYGAGKYTISCKPYDGSYVYVRRIYADGSLGEIIYLLLPAITKPNSTTMELAENEGILIYNAAGNSSKEATKQIITNAEIQVEIGETATAYEPPMSGTTITAEMPDTVYGGSYDFATGLLTLTHIGKALRATDISYKSTSVSVNTSCFVTKPDTTLAVGRMTSMCSHFKNTFDKAFKADTAIHGIFSDHSTITTKYFAWGEPDATVADFQNWLEEQYTAGTPVMMVYQLAEPQTIQLTPQQLELLNGYNNVWCDTGNTTLSYITDTKLYIDGKFTELQNAIVSLGSNV